MEQKKEEKKPIKPPLNSPSQLQGAGEIAGAVIVTAHDGDIFKALSSVAKGALSLNIARQPQKPTQQKPVQASKKRSVLDAGKQQKPSKAKKQAITTGPVITGPTI